MAGELPRACGPPCPSSSDRRSRPCWPARRRSPRWTCATRWSRSCAGATARCWTARWPPCGQPGPRRRRPEPRPGRQRTAPHGVRPGPHTVRRALADPGHTTGQDWTWSPGTASIGWRPAWHSRSAPPTTGRSRCRRAAVVSCAPPSARSSATRRGIRTNGRSRSRAAATSTAASTSTSCLSCTRPGEATTVHPGTAQDRHTVRTRTADTPAGPDRPRVASPMSRRRQSPVAGHWGTQTSPPQAGQPPHRWRGCPAPHLIPWSTAEPRPINARTRPPGPAGARASVAGSAQTPDGPQVAADENILNHPGHGPAGPSRQARRTGEAAHDDVDPPMGSVPNQERSCRIRVAGAAGPSPGHAPYRRGHRPRQPTTGHAEMSTFDELMRTRRLGALH